MKIWVYQNLEKFFFKVSVKNLRKFQFQVFKSHKIICTFKTYKKLTFIKTFLSFRVFQSFSTFLFELLTNFEVKTLFDAIFRFERLKIPFNTDEQKKKNDHKDVALKNDLQHSRDENFQWIGKLFTRKTRKNSHWKFLGNFICINFLSTLFQIFLNFRDDLYWKQNSFVSYHLIGIVEHVFISKTFFFQLVKIQYGGEKEWKVSFEFMYPFFLLHTML